MENNLQPLPLEDSNDEEVEIIIGNNFATCDIFKSALPHRSTLDDNQANNVQSSYLSSSTLTLASNLDSQQHFNAMHEQDNEVLYPSRRQQDNSTLMSGIDSQQFFKKIYKKDYGILSHKGSSQDTEQRAEQIHHPYMDSFASTSSSDLDWLHGQSREQNYDTFFYEAILPPTNHNSNLIKGLPLYGDSIWSTSDDTSNVSASRGAHNESDSVFFASPHENNMQQTFNLVPMVGYECDCSYEIKSNGELRLRMDDNRVDIENYLDRFENLHLCKTQHSTWPSLLSNHILESDCSDVQVNMDQFYRIARTLKGSQQLQEILEAKDPVSIHNIFIGVKDYLVHIMTDKYGNYLFQKLLEVCNHSQISEIISKVAKTSVLMKASKDEFGSRSVQKLIDTLKLKGSEFIVALVNPLIPCVPSLMKNENGANVMKRCWNCMTSEQNSPLYDAVIKDCISIAKCIHGVISLEDCFDVAPANHKDALKLKVVLHCLDLSQDQYGNFMVQHVMEKDPDTIHFFAQQLRTNFASLSMQRNGSYVVEKLLESYECSIVIHELLSSGLICMLLKSPSGNYIIQTALKISQGDCHEALVKAIEPHKSVLHCYPGGSKILKLLRSSSIYGGKNC